jgi:hypothetical protein
MTAPPALTTSTQGHGRLAYRLVWLIAGVALLAGAATIGIFWNASRVIEGERSLLFETQAREMARLTRMENWISRGRVELRTILDPTTETPASSGWIDDLAGLVEEESSNGGSIDATSTTGAFASTQALFAECKAWRASYEENEIAIRATHHAVEQALDALRGQLEATEGEAALHRALSTARLRRTDGEEALRIGRQIVDELNEDSCPRAARLEIGDLALASERLLWAETSDRLADIRDNRILGALLRLSRVT